MTTDLCDGWVGRSRSYEGDSAGCCVIGHHGLLDGRLNVRDVPQGPNCAHSCGGGRKLIKG